MSRIVPYVRVFKSPGQLQDARTRQHLSRGAGAASRDVGKTVTSFETVLPKLARVDDETQQYSIAAADMERAKKSHFTYTISVESLTPSLHVALGVYDEVSRDYAVRLVDLPAPAAK